MSRINRFLSLVVGGGLAVALAPTASADMLLQYTFNDGSADTDSPTFEAANVEGGVFDASIALQDNGFNGVASNGGGISGTPSRAAVHWTTSDAPELDDYWTFTVTVADGFSADLTELSFYSNRNNRGPASWAVRSSVDAFAADLASGVNGDLDGGMELRTAVFDLQDVTGTTEFRIYAYESTQDTSDAMRIDDITLEGTVVPEPASLALLGLGGLAMLRRRIH